MLPPHTSELAIIGRTVTPRISFLVWSCLRFTTGGTYQAWHERLDNYFVPSPLARCPRSSRVWPVLR